MNKDIITISVVNYKTAWGDKTRNWNKIEGWIHCAAKAGCNLIAFPEMALTGYDFFCEPGTSREETMQWKNAEPIPQGDTVGKLAALTKELGIYVLLGMPERDPLIPSALYNAVAICGPDGYVGKARKIHLTRKENYLFTPGDKPTVFDSPYGPIGVSICYDSYQFPEIYRYTVMRGARLHVNCTAYYSRTLVPDANVQLVANSLTNGVFIATSDLCGHDSTTDKMYIGGSSIIGPSMAMNEVTYYGGKPFFSEGADICGLITATVDLDLTRTNTYTVPVKNDPVTGNMVWDPARYEKWFHELAND